jgi:transposase
MTSRNDIARIATRETDRATCFLAIELSRSSWVVALHTPLADNISLHKLKAGDFKRLLGLIERTRTRVERALGKPARVISCYEAGYDGFWLHRVLMAAGVVNHVIDPASLQVSRRARRAKTDRIDAGGMLRALIADKPARTGCSASCGCPASRRRTPNGPIASACA